MSLLYNWEFLASVQSSILFANIFLMLILKKDKIIKR